MGTIGRLVASQIGQVLFGVSLFGVVFGVVYVLVGGTELLMWLGLSRSAAGSLTVGVLVLGVIVGMGAFAKYAIDW